eukprot:CAMPEP_0180819188 /NCGR_PEP_ID=MMETSP1038_2-20121128/69611_1 /TAXON_ID=632150 /ORGANISM="Azadinium spinosum, Strain 3D9" /LENGTH=63 /DNA_ID=CAMNT_0022861181 /DNA_START=41 /DNA_END=232 /DNA_ORIENTATION=+
MAGLPSQGLSAEITSPGGLLFKRASQQAACQAPSTSTASASTPVTSSAKAGQCQWTLHHCQLS